MRHVGQGERPGAHLAGVEHGGHATHDVRCGRSGCGAPPSPARRRSPVWAHQKYGFTRYLPRRNPALGDFSALNTSLLMVLSGLDGPPEKPGRSRARFAPLRSNRLVPAAVAFPAPHGPGPNGTGWGRRPPAPSSHALPGRRPLRGVWTGEHREAWRHLDSVKPRSPAAGPPIGCPFAIPSYIGQPIRRAARPRRLITRQGASAC